MLKATILSFLFLITTCCTEAQNDSSFFKNVTIKINPTLMAGNLLQAQGEYGGIIEFPLVKERSPLNTYYKLDAFVGVGYDKFYSQTEANLPLYASAYTIRGGLNLFFTSKRKGYLGLEYFFRKWSFVNSVDYTEGSNTVFDPSSFIGAEGGYPEYLYDATVTINCLDLIYGHVSPLTKHSKHFTIEWYAGLGWRAKVIQETIIGDFDTNPTYTLRATPFSYPKEEDVYPDIKLGFMIGFIL